MCVRVRAALALAGACSEEAPRLGQQRADGGEGGEGSQGGAICAHLSRLPWEANAAMPTHGLEGL